MFGRKPRAPKPEMDVAELRKILTQSHRLFVRLLGSTRSLNDVDFTGIAEAWLLAARDFKELEGMVPQLVPFARLEDIWERFERIKTKGSKRDRSREAQSA